MASKKIKEIKQYNSSNEYDSTPIGCDAENVDMADGSTLEETITDLKKSVSDGKTAVANAITDKGVETATDAEFATMAENISVMSENQYNAGIAEAMKGDAFYSNVLEGRTFTSKYGVNIVGTMPEITPVVKSITPSKSVQKVQLEPGHYSDTSTITVTAVQDSYFDGDAVAEHVLSGEHFYSNSATRRTGTMSDYSSTDFSTILEAGDSFKIPSGYHNGNSIIEAKSLASQTESTATADKILSGYTAYVNGEKITGTAEATPSNGKVWTKSNITNQISSYYFASVINKRGMWVAGTYYGLYYSYDGMQWEKSNISNIGNVMCLHYMEAINTFFAGTSNGVYMSYDGKTWTQVANIKICSMASYGIILVCGGTSGLYYSIAGTNWIAINTISQIYICHNNGYFFAFGQNGIQYSSDGMNNWQNCTINNNNNTSSFTNSVSSVSYDEKSKYCGYMMTYAGELYYSFTGTTWTLSNTSIYFPSMYHAKGIIVGGTESKGLYYSIDNGVTWIQSNISSGKFKYIYYANGVFLAWDLTTSLYYSYDGKTWTDTNKIYPFTQILNTDGIWVAVSAKGDIYYSY